MVEKQLMPIEASYEAAVINLSRVKTNLENIRDQGSSKAQSRVTSVIITELEKLDAILLYYKDILLDN